MSLQRVVRSLVRAIALLTFLAIVATPLHAQQRSAPKRSAQALRAEYAAVLLQSGRYREAAQEYRTLLAANPGAFEYRLSLARALAWGGQLREAEYELRVLRSQRPADAAVASLLRSTRDGLEPTAQEAREWLAEEPSYVPYRLALGRALAREGDRAGGTRLLRELLQRSPADTMVRHGLASALASANETELALAQYDTLLRGGSANGVVRTTTVQSMPRATRASLLVERARVHLARGDITAAEADANESMATAPTVHAQLTLGDLARWHGQYATARASYERARAMEPQSRDVAAAFARLARDEHPPLAFAPVAVADEGWSTELSALRDNLGVTYAAGGVRRGALLANGLTVSLGAEYRRLGEHSAVRSMDLQGYAVDAVASHEIGTGAFYGRVGVAGGLVSHAGVGVSPEAGASIAGWYGAWGVGLALRSALAYPSLLTLASLQPSLAPTIVGGSAPRDEPLREQSSTLSLTGTIASADLALVAQGSRLSDGNVRRTFQLFARFPLAPRLAMLYAGSGTGFTKRSALYWDPISYASNAAGVEYSIRRVRGFAYALQVLPGIASANEGQPTGLRSVRSTALSFTSAADASYRTDTWEAGTVLTYNRGRSGDYERLGAVLRVRLTP